MRTQNGTSFNCTSSLGGGSEEKTKQLDQMDQNTKKVGCILYPDNANHMEIHREFYKEGLVVRDDDAFYSDEDKVCYVAETSDKLYTKKHFLDLCNGQEEIAEALYMGCTWMNPESLLEDWKNAMEIIQCPHCGRLYFQDNVPDKCESCDINFKWETKNLRGFRRAI